MKKKLTLKDCYKLKKYYLENSPQDMSKLTGETHKLNMMLTDYVMDNNLYSLLENMKINDAMYMIISRLDKPNKLKQILK